MKVGAQHLPWMIKVDTVTPCLFGLVHGIVGVLIQTAAVTAMFWVERHPDGAGVVQRVSC